MPPPLATRTIVVNPNSKPIQAIDKLQDKPPDLAQELAKGIYDLSFLSQRELEAGDLEGVVSRQTQVLEKLASLLS